MSKVRELNVDTGNIVVKVKDNNGVEIGEFCFNPSDPDITRRYEEVVKVLESYKFDEDPSMEELLKFSDELKDQFDYLFNYKVSDALFAKCNPLTPLADGEFYCVKVLDGLADLIAEVSSERLAGKKARINAATAKYRKEEKKNE